jgi:hypothetical protein
MVPVPIGREGSGVSENDEANAAFWIGIDFGHGRWWVFEGSGGDEA